MYTLKNISKKAQFALFEDSSYDKTYYTKSKGLFPLKLNTFTPFILEQAKIFFKILQKYNINYILCFGSNIGYMRNKRTVPWNDDYDIIIFQEDIDLFENIIPVFKKHCFDIFNPPEPYHQNYHVLSYPTFGKYKNTYNFSYFQCDIYVCYFEDNILYNVSSWAWEKYGDKLTRDIVLPIQHITFDDMIFPFMNNIEKDVEIYYGDISNPTIYLDHKDSGNLCFNTNWELSYDIYNKFINDSTNRTKDYINITEHQYINDATVMEDYIYINGLKLQLYSKKLNVDTSKQNECVLHNLKILANHNIT